MHTRFRIAAASIAGVLSLTLVSVSSRVVSAQAPPKPMLRASLSPGAVPAGSSQSLTFVLTALGQATGTMSLQIPAAAAGSPWTAPQVSNPSAAGWVSVQNGNCQSAMALRLSPGDARTVLVDFKCAPNKTFTVVYGAGAAQATAATRVGVTTFVTSSNTGRGFVPLAVQPAVTINHGPAAALRLDGLADAVAGTSQAFTLWALDQYDNVATAYRGTVAFTSTDNTVSLSNYTFTATDAGVKGFNAALKRAGSQSIAASDTSGNLTNGQDSATISPGPAASVDMAISNAANFPAWSGGPFPGIGSCGATAKDAYGNARTDLLSWSSTDDHATLGSSTPGAIAFCNFITVGDQNVTVTDTVYPDISAQMTVHVTGGPVARPDNVTVLDPTHSYGLSTWPINVIHNDTQQRQSGQVYNPLLKFFNTLYDVSQPTYTDPATGVLYQVGELGFSSDLHFLVWNLDPPADRVAVVPGATLKRCPADGTGDEVCHIDQPMPVQYTLTDSVNMSTTTLTLHLETPNTPATPPAATLTPSGSMTVNSDGQTTATISPQAGVSVPIIEFIQVVRVEPPPVPGNSSIPPGAVSVGINFNSTVTDGGCTAGATCSVPTNSVGPSSFSQLVISSTDSIPGGYVFPSAPVSTLRSPVAEAILSVPLHDMWAGTNAACSATPYDWLCVRASPAIGMTPVQIIVNETEGRSVLAFFFSVGTAFALE